MKRTSVPVRLLLERTKGLTPWYAASYYHGPVTTYKAVWNPKTQKYEPGERLCPSELKNIVLRGNLRVRGYFLEKTPLSLKLLNADMKMGKTSIH